MHSDLKLQINSLDALKAIVGNDPSLAVDLKDRIADAFIADYIRPMIGKEAHDKIMQDVQRSVDQLKGQMVEEVVGKKAQWGGTYELNSTVKKAINDEVTKTTQELVDKITKSKLTAINDAVESVLKGNKATIERYISESIDRTIHNAISDKLAGILTHMDTLSKHYALEAKKLRQTEDLERKISLTL